MDLWRLVSVVGLVGLAAGCAASTDSGSAPGASASPDVPSAPASADDGWHLAYTLAGYDPAVCQIARSSDTTKVQLRGDTCTDDGSECYDMSNHAVEVWASLTAQQDAPFGVATWVSSEECPE